MYGITETEKEGTYGWGRAMNYRSSHGSREKANVFGGSNFQEFVVDFTETGKTVKEINEALLKEHIFGGKDLSGDFEELGQSALYCVSELTTAEEMEHLAEALKNIVRRS